MGVIKRKRSPEIDRALQLGALLYEKCELAQARVVFAEAFKLAKQAGDLRARMEALTGLLRLGGEALDEVAVKRWDDELDALMAKHPQNVPPMAWYCKGAIAMRKPDFRLALRHYHRFLQAVRLDPQPTAVGGRKLTREEAVARAWTVIASAFLEMGRYQRAEGLANYLLKNHQRQSFQGVNGLNYLILGKIAERALNYDQAQRWYEQAHAAYLIERNWYCHLHVLWGFARIARVQKHYAQAYWYLDLLDRSTGGAEFNLIRGELANERDQLQRDAVDLLVDRGRAMIKTREGGQISLGKQYVLLSILEELSHAHNTGAGEADRGLSKSELIERVWHEKYRPKAHDNKLYYNINRLRKLIEPDTKHPQYLLNWREGYRLAPGLKIRMVESEN